jgi:DNA-binding GntR family transcriptional regulator
MIKMVRMAATDTPERTNLAEQVYARLKAELHDFKLVPGDRFSEAELGARLGVSRTPVREALFRLRNEGFLDLESKAGWCVRPIDFARLEQLYDLRVLLELASVARLCARTDAVPELDELKAIWLVSAAERSSTPRWCAPPATPRSRACTGTSPSASASSGTWTSPAPTASTPPTPSTPRSCAR